MYSQVYLEGHQFLVFEEISDHHSYGTAITVEDGFIMSQCGNKHPKKKTRGWDLLTQIREAFSIWVPLNYLKERNPVEISKYAVGGDFTTS